MSDEHISQPAGATPDDEHRGDDAPDFADPAEFPNYDDKDAGEVEVEERLERTYDPAAAQPEAEH